MWVLIINVCGYHELCPWGLSINLAVVSDLPEGQSLFGLEWDKHRTKVTPSSESHCIVVESALAVRVGRSFQTFQASGSVLLSWAIGAVLSHRLSAE